MSIQPTAARNGPDAGIVVTPDEVVSDTIEALRNDRDERTQQEAIANHGEFFEALFAGIDEAVQRPDADSQPVATGTTSIA